MARSQPCSPRPMETNPRGERQRADRGRALATWLVLGLLVLVTMPPAAAGQSRRAGGEGADSAVAVPGAADCLGVPAYPEIRPQNAAQNQTPGEPPDPAQRGWLKGFEPYYDRISGQGCLGTTEQILEWAARKWGFDQ